MFKFPWFFLHVRKKHISPEEVMMGNDEEVCCAILDGESPNLFYSRSLNATFDNLRKLEGETFFQTRQQKCFRLVDAEK